MLGDLITKEFPEFQSAGVDEPHLLAWSSTTLRSSGSGCESWMTRQREVRETLLGKVGKHEDMSDCLMHVSTRQHTVMLQRGVPELLANDPPFAISLH